MPVSSTKKENVDVKFVACVRGAVLISVSRNKAVSTNACSAVSLLATMHARGKLCCAERGVEGVGSSVRSRSCPRTRKCGRAGVAVSAACRFVLVFLSLIVFTSKCTCCCVFMLN
ncbi:unnamed protein product [Ectocarpus sp. 12 AP-2014]